MRVKLVLGGEAVNIPKTDIGLGVAFIRVWVDGNGFTSASNDLGALGYGNNLPAPDSTDPVLVAGRQSK